MPRVKVTSFDAVRRALSNGAFNIVINQTNETFRYLKPIKSGFPEIFHRTIRSTTCATCETYCIQLSLTSSIDWCTFHYYLEEVLDSKLFGTLDVCYGGICPSISCTRTCIIDKTHIIRKISMSSIDWYITYCNW